MIQKKCAFHPTQNLVNFCRNSQCMLPMCPSCVKIHTAEHIKFNTYGNYDCISDIHTEVQSTLEKTLKTLISNGNQLKQTYKTKQQEKARLVFKMKQMRAKVLDTINKYIDSLEQDILNQVSAVENFTEEQFCQIDNSIQQLSQEASKEIYNLNNEKEMKTIISHISASMPQYYTYKLNEISAKINQIKGMHINIEKQFKGNEINQALKSINQCYEVAFVQAIKKRTFNKINLNDSNASKMSKDLSTQCSHKKVL